MNWASWSDFFHMGGYGFYVWGSYAVTLAALLLEISLLMKNK
jgi:heme exporter protein D